MSFDWTKVDGYKEDMTNDEKVALLEKFTMPEPTEGFIAKAQFDKVSRELAAAKKQLKEKLTEDEQREADRLAAEKEMKDELEVLRKEKTVNAHKASFLAQGYDEKLADKAAKAMADGDMNTVFTVMKQHGEDREKALRAEILKGTPTPPAGEDGDDKSDGEKLAERLGKEAAASNKAASDILAHYI